MIGLGVYVSTRVLVLLLRIFSLTIFIVISDI